MSDRAKALALGVEQPAAFVKLIIAQPEFPEYEGLN